MATTPEGKVKVKIRKLLANYRPIYIFMPVPVAYQAASLDYLICYLGRFIAIEAKRGGNERVVVLPLIDRDREARYLVLAVTPGFLLTVVAHRETAVCGPLLVRRADVGAQAIRRAKAVVRKVDNAGCVRREHRTIRDEARVCVGREGARAAVADTLFVEGNRCVVKVAERRIRLIEDRAQVELAGRTARHDELAAWVEVPAVHAEET